MAKKNSTKGETLIIDVGSGSVGAAFLSKGTAGMPRMSAVSRVPVGSGTEASRGALSQNTEAALKKLFERYAKEHIRTVRMVLAAPWHEAHIRTVSSKAKQAARITGETVTRAISRYQDEKPPQSGNVDVEAVALQVEVNGYGTALSRAMSGTSININLYESEMASDVKERLTSLVESAFPHATIAFNTFPLTALVALRSLVPETAFVILDVAGEASEALVMHDDALQHLGSFPVGAHALTRALTEGENGVGDARSRLTLFARGELSPDDEAVFKERYAKAFAAWREAFDDIMHDASEHTPIPRLLYLVGDAEVLAWLKKGFEEQNTFGFNLVSVEAPLVQGAVELGEEGSYDIFLALAAIFYWKGDVALIGDGQGEPVGRGA